MTAFPALGVVEPPVEPSSMIGHCIACEAEAWVSLMESDT